MRRLLAALVLVAANVAVPVALNHIPATALQFADSGFTGGQAGGWYIFYSSAGTVTHFRVKVLCGNGWHVGNMVWTANTQSTYTCPAAYRPATSVTAEVFYN